MQAVSISQCIKVEVKCPAGTLRYGQYFHNCKRRGLGITGCNGSEILAVVLALLEEELVCATSKSEPKWSQFEAVPLLSTLCPSS